MCTLSFTHYLLLLLFPVALHQFRCVKYLPIFFLRVIPRVCEKESVNTVERLREFCQWWPLSILWLAIRCFFYNNKSWNSKRHPFANVKSFLHLMWKMFAILVGQIQSKLILQTCNLWTGQYVSYKAENQFWFNLPHKKFFTSNVKNFSHLQIEIFCYFDLCHCLNVERVERDGEKAQSRDNDSLNLTPFSRKSKGKDVCVNHHLHETHRLTLSKYSWCI